MRKLWWLVGLVALGLTCGAASAQGPITGYCTLGAKQASVQATNSTNYLQGIIRGCTVTVFFTGTTTQVPGTQVFSDAMGTILGNPFTANTATGQWLFYVSTSSLYDVQFSGGIPPNTYSAPQTLTGLQPAGGGGSTGFPLTLGATPIAANSTTTAVTGLTVNGVTLDATGANTQFLNRAGGYTTPAGGVTQIVPGTNITVSPGGGTGVVTINSTGGNSSVTFAASLTSLGDSIPAGFLLSSPSTQSYPALMASTFGVSLNNYAIPGDMACDVFRTQIYPNSVTSGQDAAPIGTMGVGTNDADIKGTGAYEATFNSCYQAVQAWMLTPSEYTVLAGNAGNSVTGTCSNTPNSGVFGGAICGTGAGTITFTTPALGTLYGFWYYVDDTLSGTNCFTYQVDSGTVSSCIPAVLTPHMATQNGGAASIAWFPISGASANTAHTVRFSTTVGTIAILGVALVPPQPFFQHQVLASSDIPNQKTPPNASVPTQVQYSLDISNNVTYFKGLGFDARYVPTRNYMLATTAEMNDTLHPAYPLGTEHMASAFKETLQATPGGACQVNCTFLGTTTLNSGISTPSIIKANVSGSPSVFMQNTNVAGFAGIQFLDTAGGQQGGVFLAGSSNTFYPGYVGLFTNSVPIVIGDIFHGPGTAAIEIAYPTQVPKFNYGLLGQTVAPTGACGSGGLAGSLPGEFVLSQDGAITRCLAGTWTTFGGAGGGTVTTTGSPASTQMAKFSGATSITNATPGSDFVSPNAGTAYVAGNKQTFAPNGSFSGINVGGVSADPSTLGNGDIWYNTTSNTFNVRQGGTTQTLAVGTGAVSSVSNSNNTLTVTPTTGAVVASLNLANANTWSGQQTFVAPILGIPASGVATNITGLPISTGVSGLGSGIATFLATPSSANLAAALTDETGTGAAVFAGSPALTGVPTAPTASPGTNTTQLATTAYVLANAGVGTVTHTGALTAQKCVIGNGTADVKVDPNCSLDGSGNLSVVAGNFSGTLTVAATGNGLAMVETTAPSGVALSDLLYPDSTAHRLKMNNNNGGAFNIPGIASAATAGHIATYASNGIDIVDGGAVPTGAVASVTATNTTLTISPTTGAVLAGLNIANANIWTATQSINLTGSTHPTLPVNTIDFTANVSGSSTRRVSSSFGATSFFSVLRADGTAGSPTQVLAGEQVGGINAWAFNNASAYNGPIASMRLFADENQTNAAAGSRMEFITTPDGSTTAVSRLSIEADGGVIITGISASTSAICPHGTGGRLTTTGCAASGTVGGGTSGWSGTPLTFISSTTQYAPPVGGALTSATESIVQNAAPAAATLSGLQVTLSAALGAGATLQVTLRDAAAGTTLTCTTASGGTSCSDITHSVNVAQGDLLDLQLVSSGTVTAGVPQIVVSYAVGTSNVGTTSFASGNLSPLFTTSVATSTTTPVQSFALTNAAANKFLGNNTGSIGAPGYVSIGASDWSPNAYIAGAGSVNVMTATLVPAVTALTAGLRVQVLPNLANTTTTPTLNVNGLGAKTITKKGAAALAANDYTTTQIADFEYDGTEWQLMNPQTVTAGGGISSYCAGRGYVAPAAVASGTTNYYACQNFSTSSAVSTATVIANAGTSGCSATFNIDATTTNTVSLTFQWQKASAGSTTFSNIGSALILAASTSVSTQTVSFSGATAVGDRIVIQVSLPVGTTIGTSQMTNPSMVCN